MKMTRTRCWSTLCYGWCACGLLALLSGCGFIPSRAEQLPATLPLDFRAALPAGWEPLESWREINVDDDEAPEYLLFFRFDGDQIGAAIFDIQIPTDLVGLSDVAGSSVTTDTLAPAPVSLQSFGTYLPHRLLPSFWAFNYGGGVEDGVGHGVIAPPGTEASAIHVYTVRGTEASAPATELLVRGGTTHLTFVWWKGRTEGYGLSQLVATGGFDGIAWDTWAENTTPVKAVTGLTPLQGFRARSGLCHAWDYTRLAREPEIEEETLEQVEPPDPVKPEIAFDAADAGIRFCTPQIPHHPYYPEGVVLAYLLGLRPSSDGLKNLLADGVTLLQIDTDADIARLALERVEDVDTYPTVPVNAATLRSGEFAPTTVVCVELADKAQPNMSRWVLFTLRYLPPNLEQRLPDRWVIAGAQMQPQPIARPEAPHCRHLLATRP
jgi:hypothetical protein